REVGEHGVEAADPRLVRLQQLLGLFAAVSHVLGCYGANVRRSDGGVDGTQAEAGAMAEFGRHAKAVRVGLAGKAGRITVLLLLGLVAAAAGVDRAVSGERSGLVTDASVV